MARAIRVELLGDASSLERAFLRSARAAEHWERQMTGITKTIKYAAAGLVGGYGLTYAFEQVIKVASDVVVSQRALQTQMRVNHESFKTNRAAIEEAELSLARFGFTSEQSAHALVTLDRATGNIRQSMGLQAGVANIARASNRSLEVAALAVAKVFGGQETALRRLIPGLPKAAHGLALIADAFARTRGQAAAGTTPLERFRSTLFNTEKIIGGVLLPTVNKYLGRLSVWLDRMNRTGRLERDFKQITDGVRSAIELLSGAMHGLNAVTGSTKNSVKLLLGVFLAFKTAKVVGVMSDIATSVALVGTKAKTSTAEVGGLRGALIALPKTVGPITIAFALAAGTKDTVYNWLHKAFHVPTSWLNYDPFYHGRAITNLFRGGAAAGGLQLPRRPPTIADLFGGGPIPQPATAGAGTAATDLATVRPGLTASEERAIALAGHPTLAAYQAQRAYDWQAIAFLKRRLARGKITPAEYTKEMVAVLNDVANMTDAIVAMGKPARKAAEKAKKAAEKARESFEEPLRLQLAEARATALGKHLRPILLEMRRAAYAALRSGKLAIQGQIDAWNAIAQLNDQLKKGAQKALRKNAIAMGRAYGAEYQLAYAVGGPTIHIEHFYSSASSPRALENELARRARARGHVRRGAR